MSAYGSICCKEAVKMLEKIIGIEHQVDFVDENFSTDQSNQIHQNALAMTYGALALDQIRCQLGYLPRREATFKSEGAIQQLLFEYMHHHLNVDILFDSCNSHLNDIYRREMEPHKVARYPKEIYELYETLFPEFKENAKRRIVQFSENNITLDLTIYAELVMRCRLVTNKINLTMVRNEIDYEAESIISFRRNYLNVKAIKS